MQREHMDEGYLVPRASYDNIYAMSFPLNEPGNGNPHSHNLQSLVQQQQQRGSVTPIRSATFSLRDQQEPSEDDEHRFNGLQQKKQHPHDHTHSHNHAGAPCSNEHPQEVHDDEDEPTKRKRRKQVERACSNCRRSKTACSSERPCKRCTGHGIESTCIDAPRKRRAKKAKLSLEDQFLWHEFSKFVGDSNSRTTNFLPNKLFGDANSNVPLSHSAAAHQNDPDNDETNLGTVLKKRQRSKISNNNDEGINGKTLEPSGPVAPPAPFVKNESDFPSLFGSSVSSPSSISLFYNGGYPLMGGMVPSMLQQQQQQQQAQENGDNDAQESVPEFSHLLQDLWRPLRVPVHNADFAEGSRPGLTNPVNVPTNFLINASSNGAVGPFGGSASARFPSDFFKFSASNSFLAGFGDGSQNALPSQSDPSNGSSGAIPTGNGNSNNNNNSSGVPFSGSNVMSFGPGGLVNSSQFALSSSPKSSFSLHFGINEPSSNRQSLELFFQSLLADSGQNPGFQPVA